MSCGAMTNYFTSAIKIGQKVRRKKYCLGVKKLSLGVQKNPKLIQMLGIIGRNGIQLRWLRWALRRGSLIIVIGRGAALWNLIVANIWRGSNLFLPALSLTLYSSCLPALLKPNLKQPKKINNSSLQNLKLPKYRK